MGTEVALMRRSGKNGRAFSSGRDIVHNHSQSASTARDLWREVVEGEPSADSDYGYCPVCGAIKARMNHGRNSEFFSEALSRLRKSLAEEGEDITDSSVRAIRKEMSEDGKLSDPHSSTYDSQVDTYVAIVADVMPDIAREKVVRSLFQSND